MVCYPIIYTRTFNCDYFANFHVLPDFVDSRWLLPYIRSATTDMSPASNIVRKIIISNEDVCIFGIIAYAKDIMKDSLQNFFHENKGRAVYGFYGFAVRINGNSAEIPVFSNDDISNIYEHYIIPVWENPVQQTQMSLSVRLNEEQVNDTEIRPEYIYNDSVNLFLSEENLYESLLYKAFNGDCVSYCSCINDYKALKMSSFNYIVTSLNNLNRLKNEPVIREEPVIHKEPVIRKESDINEILNGYTEEPVHKEFKAKRLESLHENSNLNSARFEKSKTKYKPVDSQLNNPLNSYENSECEFGGSKKNKDKNKSEERIPFEDFFEQNHQKTFSKEELEYELEKLLRKFCNSDKYISLAVTVSASVISSIFKLSGMEED